MADDDLAFLNLVLTLGNLARSRLDGAERGGERRNEQLKRARDVVDMLTALRKRTAGRLTPAEDKVLDALLRDLQTGYVRALARGPGAAADA
jgi:hypothetical protein